MYISVDNNNCIKEVGINPNLTSLYINDEENPFKDWSEAKICCYKVEVKDGIVTMMTPYLDSRLIEHIDQLGRETEQNAESIEETNAGLMETYEGTLDNATSISELELALEEVYEMIGE